MQGEAGPCPKCGDPSWFVQVEEDLVQRCLCGVHRIVRTTVEGLVIVHRPRPKDVMLPKEGTKIQRCLKALHNYHPRHISTLQVALVTVLESADVSMHLTLLMQRGLIDRVEIKRGKAGGSTWQLTTRAMALLNIKR